jgi:hypothetical protein
VLGRYSIAGSITGIAALALTWASLHAQKPTPSPSIDFVRDIQPILRTHCYECHGPNKQKHGLRLDLRSVALKGGETGPAVIPGNSQRSLVMRRVLGLDGEDRMPKDEDPLAKAQIDLIRTWIDQGAAWPEHADQTVTGSQDSEPQRHWAYRAPVRQEPPAVRNTSWVRTPIDRFILARLEQEGLTSSAEAGLETLVRRVSLDLVGLPPSPQEMDEVAAEAERDGKDSAYAHLVDRLLASPHYGERWARPWLDLARYADSHGYEKDLPRVMWKYRDWVIGALNRDMPFDQFTIEQIAGDMLPDATTDQLIASGFHRNAMTNEEGGIDPAEAHYEVLVDRVNTTATVWLGTTLACAQCHDHKYDPFTQRDYYRMMAFFSNSDYQVKKLGDGTKYAEAMIDVPTPEQETKRKAIQSEIDRLNERAKNQTPALDGAQAAWEKGMRLEPLTRWKVLAPKRLTATGGVVLTSMHDGSVMASGSNPGETVYTLDDATTLPVVTAIRLEALPDPSLPKGGPGRDVYGNFQLNRVDIESVTSSESDSLALQTIRAIKGDDSAGGANLDSFFPKVLPRDASVPRGWRIDASRDDTRLPRQIVFTLDRPLRNPAGVRLRIRLTHQGSAVGQALGRFRLSATSSSNPQRVVEIPAKLRPVLAVPVASRTETQRTDLSAFYRTVAPSLGPTRDRLAVLEKALEQLSIPTALVMRERVAYERPSAYVHRRGNFTDTTEKVYADVPEVLHPLGEDQMPNRLGLAHWLVDERNPLTARVAVNRAWEQFFGRGLVETSEDFGTRGTPPSHPELLDWLATEVVRSGWQMKALHKLIVTSAAYRQTSVATPLLVERDPYNRLLARGPRFRMEAEMVRDTILAASGLLNLEIGGPSVFPPQPEGIWDIPYSDEKWIPSTGEARYRRGLYVFIRRSAPYPSFLTFDATSRERCTVRRVRTNTPLQALTTLNDEAFFEAARALAARILREPSSVPVSAGGSTGGEELVLKRRATYAFRMALSRTPTSGEIDRIIASYKAHLEHFRTDRGSAESVVKDYEVGGTDAGEQAAWTLVANALLNLDETLTKE